MSRAASASDDSFEGHDNFVLSLPCLSILGPVMQLPPISAPRASTAWAPQHTLNADYFKSDGKSQMTPQPPPRQFRDEPMSPFLSRAALHTPPFAAAVVRMTHSPNSSSFGGDSPRALSRLIIRYAEKNGRFMRGRRVIEPTALVSDSSPTRVTISMAYKRMSHHVAQVAVGKAWASEAGWLGPHMWSERSLHASWTPEAEWLGRHMAEEARTAFAVLTNRPRGGGPAGGGGGRGKMKSPAPGDGTLRSPYTAAHRRARRSWA